MSFDLEKMINLTKQGDVYISHACEFESDQWLAYQKRELGYWRKLYDLGYYPDYKTSFYRTLTKFGVDADYFAGKQLLEIGCGPQGFSANLVQTAEKQPLVHVVVDSLLDKYQDFPTFSLFGKDTIKIKALGEKIPVPSDMFDVIVCQNVLDHVNKPSAVVSEIYRTLKMNGTALISVHILPPSLMFFETILKKLDKNHPHHFTLNYVQSLFNKFEIVSCYSIPLYKDNPEVKKKTFKSLKLLLAARLLCTLYLKVRKI